MKTYYWNLDQLQSFVRAADKGSFSAAARSLGKAQSRISSSISDLESELGLSLFDRSRRLPTLTIEGKEMLSEARTILEQCERLHSRALSAANKHEISLVIACDEAMQIGLFQPMYRQLIEQFPHLKLTLINGSRDDIASAVKEGRADFGVMMKTGHLSDELEFYSIGYYRHVLIVGLNHPLASVDSPSVSELQAYRQFVICDRYGKDKETPVSANHWDCDSYFNICDLVTSDLGWALVPEHIALLELYRNRVKVLPDNSISQTMLVENGIVRRRGSPVGDASRWIATELEKALPPTRDSRD